MLTALGSCQTRVIYAYAHTYTYIQWSYLAMLTFDKTHRLQQNGEMIISEISAYLLKYQHFYITLNLRGLNINLLLNKTVQLIKNK